MGPQGIFHIPFICLYLRLAAKINPKIVGKPGETGPIGKPGIVGPAGEQGKT